MKRRLAFTFVALAMLVMVSAAGADVRSLFQKPGRQGNPSTPSASKSYRGGRSINARNYRSPGKIRKVVVPSDDAEALVQAKDAGAVEVSDYGSFKLMAIDQSALDVLQRGEEQRATTQEKRAAEERRIGNHSLVVRDDYNVLLLRSGAIDTMDEESAGIFLGLGREARLTGKSRVSSRRGKVSESPLRLIQFVGPVKRAWLEELEVGGFELIAYVPNNGYLVRGDANAGERLNSARTRGEEFVQWEGPFTDEYKVHPSLIDLMRGPAGIEVAVAVQLARSRFDNDQSSNRDLKAVMNLASTIISKPYPVQGFFNLKMRVDSSRISEIAKLTNVVNIEPWAIPELFDERAAKIVVGDFSEDGKKVNGPGYLSWLQSRGLGSRFNFAIDVTDTGMDRGKTGAGDLHPDFLDSSGQSRVVYARNYTGDLDAGDVPGHGTINVSIAGGANFSTDKGARDSAEFGHGIGIAPFALLGSSKIFESDGRFGLNEPFSNLIAAAYRDGARISSNSWGATANSYTIDAQEYDFRVRDALPSDIGNQEIVICFAAGNGGVEGSIGSPGTAKNVITVGASEGLRDSGIDGCGVRNEDADNAFDIVFFSSAGPLDDGRIKPDICAPGSHIQGAASQHQDFDGLLVCGEDLDKPYFPQNQTLYTLSSGTSHSTPQVAGAAALARQYFLNRGMDASPALVKAMLSNSTRYMSGELSGGSLPQSRQGWGLMDMDRAFDDTPKILINQTHTFSDSGQEMIITGEVKNSSLPFRVTLAWTDAPGFSAFAPWVNDLDLEVIINGQVYGGNNFKGDQSQAGGEPDTKNNVESVWLPAGTIGTFAVRVRASNVAGDGVPGNADFADQDFALVVYNAEKRDVAVATLENVSVTGGPDDAIDPGETVSMKVRLKDSSPINLTGGQGVLSTSTSGIMITSAAANYPDIASGDTGENAQDFAFTVAPDVECGTLISFTLDVNHQGALSRMSFIVIVGTLSPAEFFEDDIESGEAKWTHGSGIKKKKKRIDTWTLSTERFRSGGSSWFTPDLNKLTDAHLDTLPIQLPAESRNMRLTFYHTFSFEGSGFDGGVLEISTGGEFEDLGPKILQGGYNGSILSFVSNPLIGREAWTDGRLGEFRQVVVDLSSYAGKTVIIRFRIGTDSSVGGLGWYVDDVAINGDRVTCAPVVLANQ